MPDSLSFVYVFSVAFGTWFIGFMDLVPISLMVTLEVVKFIQAKFIQLDFMIYDVEKDMPTKVQSSNLNEELGMIHYIFSDKTGTLTQNVMEFKKFTAGKISYGQSETDDAKKRKCSDDVTNVNFEDPLFDKNFTNKNSQTYKDIMKLTEVLGLCHTIIEENKPDGTLKYNASSPDELALANAARYFGFEFRGRDADNNICVMN